MAQWGEMQDYAVRGVSTPDAYQYSGRPTLFRKAMPGIYILKLVRDLKLLRQYPKKKRIHVLEAVFISDTSRNRNNIPAWFFILHFLSLLRLSKLQQNTFFWKQVTRKHLYFRIKIYTLYSALRLVPLWVYRV